MNDVEVAKIRGDHWRWIEQAPLLEIASNIKNIYQYKPLAIDGTCIALLAQRLVAAEVAVGGPYISLDGSIDPQTNAMIAQLFEAFGNPLANLASFLELPTDIAPAKFVPTLQSSPVVDRVQQQLSQLDPLLIQPAMDVWRVIARADTQQEISMLPTFFAESLTVSHQAVTDELCLQLGVANFYTWMAYTVYDDFIDEEGTPRYLPVANRMHRTALQIYLSIAGSHRLVEHQLYQSFDDMDTANAWELAHCRSKIEKGSITINSIPHFGSGRVLARRAGAHILGPIILSTLHRKITTTQQTLITRALTHYLIARQLNDDAHDWLQDINNGQISFVVALLLRGANINPGKYKITDLVKKLEVYFWRTGLKKTSLLTMYHIDQARVLFRRSGVIKGDSPLFEHVLQPIYHSAQESLRRHSDEKQFLRVYRAS